MLRGEGVYSPAAILAHNPTVPTASAMVLMILDGAPRAISWSVFASLLHQADARRATGVVVAVLAHGLRCALTGGLAIDAQLRVHGRSVEPRVLNDIDFVVENFASIPGSLAASFLQHHVHPDAINGRTLLQLVDEPRAIRIDPSWWSSRSTPATPRPANAVVSTGPSGPRRPAESSRSSATVRNGRTSPAQTGVLSPPQSRT